MYKLYFFLSVNGIATSNVFSNARGKLILLTIQFCFRLDLFLGLKGDYVVKQAPRQTAFISILLEQFNLLLIDI